VVGGSAAAVSAGVPAVDCLKGLAAWRGGGAMSGGVLEFDIRWEIIASNLALCRFRVGLKVLNSSPHLFMDFDLRGLLRRVAEEVEAEIRQVEKELAEARRGGARWLAEELSAVRDILYEDK
jgi:hypothetical protein